MKICRKNRDGFLNFECRTMQVDLSSSLIEERINVKESCNLKSVYSAQSDDVFL